MHYIINTFKGLRATYHGTLDALLNAAIPISAKKKRLIRVSNLLVNRSKQSLHVFEVSKKRANANTRSIRDLLGCGDQHALLLQGERGFNDGATTPLTAKPTAIYSNLSFCL